MHYYSVECTVDKNYFQQCDAVTWPFLLVFLVVVEITPIEAVLGGGGGGGAGDNTEAQRNYKI